jgi:tRNA (guanine37-N1)-methyltransferase
MFGGVLGESILKRAQERGLARINLINLRDFSKDRHKKVDAPPYGGGPGMVLMAEPVIRAVEDARRAHGGAVRTILLTPQGRRFDQATALGLASARDGFVLVCGRYEGVDERVAQHLATEELSLGDFVLTGGEVAALAVTEATVRLLPGALGDEGSAGADSFEDGILDFPHYTRPATVRGRAVPEPLLSGDHARIRRWRRKQALRATRERRPELLAAARLGAEDRALLREIEEEAAPAAAEVGGRGGRHEKAERKAGP